MLSSEKEQAADIVLGFTWKAEAYAPQEEDLNAQKQRDKQFVQPLNRGMIKTMEYELSMIITRFKQGKKG